MPHVPLSFLRTGAPAAPGAKHYERLLKNMRGRDRAESAGPTTLFSPEWYANPSNRGRWVCQEILHQGRVWIHYQGPLQSSNQLPQHPGLWDEYCTPGATWVWMIPAGATTPQWVNP